MNSEDSPARAVLEELLAAVGEYAARRIVRETGRQSAVAELERVIALDFAIRLLEQKAPRWQVRDRLVSRGMSRATAYRFVSDALGAGPRNCLNEGPEMRRDPETLDGPINPEISP